MLASAVVVVRITEPATLDRLEAARLFLGRAAQAIFLEAVSRIDPVLAAELHEGTGAKPYTCSAALVPPAGPGGSWLARLRYTALSTLLSPRLGAILDGVPTTLRLDTMVGEREAILVEPEQAEDVGMSSYQEIINRRLLTPNPPTSRLTFRFLTPTTFHTNGRNQPLPLPGLVFGSLVDRWNSFSQLALNADARRFAEECLVVSHFRIASQLVDLAGGKQIGFVGTVGYRALRQDEYWLRVIGALADVATFAGVGAKTTMGMGQTRRIADDGSALRRGTGSDRTEDR